MQTLRKLGLLALIVTALAGGCARPSTAQPADAGTTAQLAGAHGLPNGLYAVVREDGDAVFLDRSTYVPLILDRPAEAADDASGRPMLSVTLAHRYVKLLADFTRAHLGGSVALVFGGEILSVHKVRTVIEGGQMKITRCTQGGMKKDERAACETIRSKLDVEGSR